MNHFLTSNSSPFVKNELLVSMKEWLELNKCETYVNVANLETQYFNLETHSSHFVLNLLKNEGNEIVILNRLGQKVYSYSGSKKRIVIEKTALPSGILFLKINNNSTIFKKLNL